MEKKKMIQGMGLTTVIAALALSAGGAHSQTAANPATRQHVKMVGDKAFKFTSKLAKVVELNFTMGYSHAEGKPIISNGLDRIAKSYAMGGKDAFTVQHIVGPSNGTEGGVPEFTSDDILSGQVIVANNISGFGNTTLGTTKQTAIQKAIETDGRGYLAFHGSGDNTATGWSWYTNQLHPMNYQGHGARTNGPVYKHLEESSHIILQGILASKTVLAQVPNEVNAAGVEQYATDVPTRPMKNEWYRFGRDISKDATYGPRTTILLKYDPRELGTALDPQFRRKGGNLYTYLFKVGAGTTSYIPAGHTNDELLDPGTGFDGGAGDYDRYVAQTLFFLAGYTSMACDASCSGLPIVDAKNRLTGQTVGIMPGGRIAVVKDVAFESNKMAFSNQGRARYVAKVSDITGKVLLRKVGQGAIYHEFDQSSLKPGVYFMSVKIGSAAAKVKRYAVAAR